MAANEGNALLFSRPIITVLVLDLLFLLLFLVLARVTGGLCVRVDFFGRELVCLMLGVASRSRRLRFAGR